MAPHTIEQPPDVEIEPGDRVQFAVAVVLGTLATAGLFGLMTGGIAGLIIGPIIACVYGVPIFLATLLTAWSRLFSRLYAISALVCGMATGFLSSSALPSGSEFVASVIVASSIGGAGGLIAGLHFIRNSAAGRRLARAANTSRTGSRFGQVLLHLGIVAIMGFSLFRGGEKFFANRSKAEQDRIERESGRSSRLKD